MLLILQNSSASEYEDASDSESDGNDEVNYFSLHIHKNMMTTGCLKKSTRNTFSSGFHSYMYMH